jgi:hypothetical protein
MSTDIHLSVEARINGKWVFVGDAQPGADYNMFGHLAGVRRSNVNPIAEGRGIPLDATMESFLRVHRPVDGKALTASKIRMVATARRIGAEMGDILEPDPNLHGLTWFTAEELGDAMQACRSEPDEDGNLVSGPDERWTALAAFCLALPEARLVASFDN